MWMVPEVSRPSPARQCNRVDLPEPEGPMIALNRPLSKAIVMPSSARTMASPLPYSLTASVVLAATGRASDAAVGAPVVVIAAIGCQGNRCSGWHDAAVPLGQVAQLEPGSSLVVGDPRRRQLGRAAFGTLVVAALFLVFTLCVKQFRVLSDHVPWQNDPYDAVVSFTVFFVLLTAAMGGVRISLCRRDG